MKYLKIFDGIDWNYWKIYESRGLARLTEDPYDISYIDESHLIDLVKLRTRTVEQYLKSKYKDVKEHPSEWIFTFKELEE